MMKNNMHPQQVLENIREAMAKYKGPERDLLEVLLDEAEIWKMRLDELNAEDDN